MALGIPPLGETDARATLARLRAAPVLEGTGARGQGPADLDFLVEVFVRFSWLCVDLVGDIDVNPLFASERGKGAVVADALIVPEQAAGRASMA